MKNIKIILITLVAVFVIIIGVVALLNKNSVKNEVKKNIAGMHGQYFSLDTEVDIKIYDSDNQDIMDGVATLIDDLGKKIDAYDSNSEVYRLNHSNGEFVEVSKVTLDCIKEGIKYADITNGRFDISIGAVSFLWDFKNHNSKPPKDELIKEKLKLVNYKDIEISGNKVRLKKVGMQIDLGAIAKGYIADKAKEYLQEKGIKSAIINLGGNVYCLGSKEGKPFKVGIQNPDKARNEIVGVIDDIDKSSVTSGIYERYIDYKGKRYSHILDTHTGYSVNNNLSQVTIYSETSTEGDALSTSCFLLGLDKGMKLINSLDNVEALFITKDGNKHFSYKFKDKTHFISD